MSIKYAILGLLAERPLHGYELKAAYDTELFPGSPLNFGQVYTTLERLARDGLVAGEVVSQAERPDKKVYATGWPSRRRSTWAYATKPTSNWPSPAGCGPTRSRWWPPSGAASSPSSTK